MDSQPAGMDTTVIAAPSRALASIAVMPLGSVKSGVPKRNSVASCTVLSERMIQYSTLSLVMPVALRVSPVAITTGLPAVGSLELEMPICWRAAGLMRVMGVNSPRERQRDQCRSRFDFRSSHRQ